MTKEQIEIAIREYIPHIVHMSLSTCIENKPWTTEVHFVYDDTLNLYFISRPSRRHSQEIASNNSVSGTIVTQHTAEEKSRWVYFEGKVAMISVTGESDPLFQLFQQRLWTSLSILEEALEENGHRFYKITVDNYYLFDSKKFVLPRH